MDGDYNSGLLSRTIVGHIFDIDIDLNRLRLDGPKILALIGRLGQLIVTVIYLISPSGVAIGFNSSGCATIFGYVANIRTIETRSCGETRHTYCSKDGMLCAIVGKLVGIPNNLYSGRVDYVGYLDRLSPLIVTTSNLVVGDDHSFVAYIGNIIRIGICVYICDDILIGIRGYYIAKVVFNHNGCRLLSSTIVGKF